MSKGFKGMPGNLQNLLQQAQKVQEEIKKAQENAKEFVAEASSGGGMVKVSINGDYQVVKIEIDPEVIDKNEKEMLEDLIVAATNEALKKVQSHITNALERAAGGLAIPGLF